MGIVNRVLIAGLAGSALFGAYALLQGSGMLRAEDSVPVIDGDTLVVEGRLIQLAGIDAPELGQRCSNDGKAWRCGLEAALVLRKMIAFGTTECAEEDSEAETALASCTVDGKDLAIALLQQGYARGRSPLPDRPGRRQGCQNRHLARRFRGALGLAGRRPLAGRDHRRAPVLRHQGHHQREGPAGLLRALRRGLRRDLHRPGARRAHVLQRRPGDPSRLAPLPQGQVLIPSG